MASVVQWGKLLRSRHLGAQRWRIPLPFCCCQGWRWGGYGVPVILTDPHWFELTRKLCWIYEPKRSFVTMPTNRVTDACLHCRWCLLYPHNRHYLLSWKASFTVMEGIRTSVSRHRYKRAPYFAMSGWQNGGFHSENGHGHSCDHVTISDYSAKICNQNSNKNLQHQLNYI